MRASIQSSGEVAAVTMTLCPIPPPTSHLPPPPAPLLSQPPLCPVTSVSSYSVKSAGLPSPAAPWLGQVVVLGNYSSSIHHLQHLLIADSSYRRPPPPLLDAGLILALRSEVRGSVWAIFRHTCSVWWGPFEKLKVSCHRLADCLLHAEWLRRLHYAQMA